MRKSIAMRQDAPSEPHTKKKNICDQIFISQYIGSPGTIYLSIHFCNCIGLLPCLKVPGTSISPIFDNVSGFHFPGWAPLYWFKAPWGHERDFCHPTWPTGSHFVNKIPKKIQSWDWSEMARNVIEIHFRSSKMGWGGGGITMFSL